MSFMHAQAEATGLPAASQDLVSMCLVAHELPQCATKAILREAFRCGCALCVTGGRGFGGGECCRPCRHTPCAGFAWGAHSAPAFLAC